MSDNNEKKKIKLKIVNTDGNETKYEIKTHIPIGKLIDKYCASQNISSKSLTVTINGLPIDVKLNSEQLGLEDDTEINVVSQQVGGQ